MKAFETLTGLLADLLVEQAGMMVTEPTKPKILGIEQDLSGILSGTIGSAIGTVIATVVVGFFAMVWAFRSDSVDENAKRGQFTETQADREQAKGIDREELPSFSEEKRDQLEEINNSMLDEIEERIEKRRQAR